MRYMHVCACMDMHVQHVHACIYMYEYEYLWGRTVTYCVCNVCISCIAYIAVLLSNAILLMSFHSLLALFICGSQVVSLQWVSVGLL